MSVSKCPVCEGKGKMPCSFYPDLGTRVGYGACRSCRGKGVIKVPEEHHHHYPAPPRLPSSPPTWRVPMRLQA